MFKPKRKSKKQAKDAKTAKNFTQENRKQARARVKSTQTPITPQQQKQQVLPKELAADKAISEYPPATPSKAVCPSLANILGEALQINAESF